MFRWASLALAILFVAGCGGGGGGPVGTTSTPPGTAPPDEVAARTLGSGEAAMERSVAQGRWMVFHTNQALLPADTNGTYDVYLEDLDTGDLTLISQGGNRASYYASLSSDGNRIAYASDATNLVAGDTNGRRDIFLHDRGAGTTERVSLTTAGAQVTGTSTWPALSADGTQVAWISEGKFVPAKTTPAVDVWFRDLSTGTTTLLSQGLAGTGGNGASSAVAMSGDGRYVAFVSAASNLVAGDTNGAADVFLHDRQASTTERVSVGPGGAQANGACANPSVSDDGRYVAWDSSATTLVAGDTNARRDVFVRDRAVGATTSPSTAGNGDSTMPTLSREGGLLAFASTASNLAPGDGNGAVSDVFWLPLADPGPRLASAGGTAASDQAAWHGQGLVFRTASANLAPGASTASPQMASVQLAPNPPTDLAAGTTGSSVSLTWTASAGAESYEVSYEGGGAPLATTSATSATVGPLADGAYSFVVRARNAAGLSAPSAPASATLATILPGSTVWAKRGGSADNDTAYGCTMGPDGTVYVVGHFFGTATFGSLQLTSAGQDDIFVIAVDPADGDVLWAARSGGANSDLGYAVAANSTGVYVTGYYESSGLTGFLSGAGASSGTWDSYVAALNPANGATLWAKRTGGSTLDIGLGLAATETAVYASGYYQGTPTGFASGAGASAGSDDAYVVSLNPANGNTVWAKRGGSSTLDRGYGVAVTGTAVYVTGLYTGTPAGFLSGVGVSGGGNDAFVAALNPTNGATLWTQRAGAAGNDGGMSVAADSTAVYVGGQYNATPTGFLSGVGTSAGAEDFFVAALGASNGGVLWRVRGGGTGSDATGMSQCLVTGGNRVYAGGHYTGTPTGFLAGVGTSAGSNDACVAAFDVANGAVAWVARSGGTGFDSVRGMALGSSGLFAAGNYNATMTGFAAAAGAAAGSNECFWARLGP